MATRDISSAPQMLALAAAAYRDGRHELAELMYRQLAAQQYGQLDFVLPLAVCLLDRGKHSEALELVERLLWRQDEPEARLHIIHGRILKAAGRIHEAVNAYRRSLAIEPTAVDAMVSLGIALRLEGSTSEAVETLQKATRVAPRHALAWVNLATALHQAGDYEEAVQALETALAFQPDLAQAHCNLGRALIELRRFEAARGALRRAVDLRPAYVDAFVNLGMLGEATGDLDQAAQSYARAIQFDPDSVDAFRGLGTVLYNRGALAQALECFEVISKRKPDNPLGPLWSGFVLREQGKVREALEAFERSSHVAPESADGFAQKGFTLWLMGEYSRARESALAALERADGAPPVLNLCANLALLAGRIEEAREWYGKAAAADPADKEGARGNGLFTLCYQDGCSAEELYNAHRAWGAWRMSLSPPSETAAPRRKPADRLRVGFVSGDFNIHSVAYFIEPVLAGLHQHGFDVFCYYNARRVDVVTKRLTEYRVSWRQVAGLTDDALSALIAADEIHVLVDLGGHTAGNRLGVFVRQPAPMQVGYLGYPTITGLPTIRFRITDWVVDPEPEEYSGSEAPLRLPDSYFCYRPPANAPNVGVRPNPGMFTFGSFNNLAKISPATLRLWAAVLKAVPASRLLLKNKSLADEVLRREFARRCADAGIDQNRLDLLAWQAATQSHLETYRDVDIALDTFPYNGATTSCEALWMGVPVVTRAGTTHASRMGASILRAAGHPQFVASTEERYVEICARLAEDRTLLAGLRRQARAHLSASALMDEPRFVAGFSAALRQAWKAQQHEG